MISMVDAFATTTNFRDLRFLAVGPLGINAGQAMHYVSVAFLDHYGHALLTQLIDC